MSCFGLLRTQCSRSLRTASSPLLHVRAFSGAPSLWERMGGEEKIRPLCGTLYTLHSTDPLTAPWFQGGSNSKGNIRTPEEIAENVFTFFSSGIGGPHEYKGNDMVAAHMHMHIKNHAFHALTNHVFVGMERHKTGGSAERDEVYDILWSLRGDVMHGTDKNAKPVPQEDTRSLWERMGGEAAIRPLCGTLYELHSTDPLTAPWFEKGPNSKGNIRTPEEIAENVFTFFSSGIGGPHEYKGNDMKAAHMHMVIPKHVFHALTNHVFVGMNKHKTGGVQEREEVYDILWSLRDDVMHGTENAGK